MPRYNNRNSFERMLNSRKYPTSQNKQVITGYKSNVQGWRTIGGKRFYARSLWEVQYAAYLEWLKCNKQIAEWEYEPQDFYFPKEAYNTGPFVYRPDFKVTGLDGTHAWHEVKGFMNASAKKKTKRFEKHFPNEMLYIISSKEMKEIAQYRKLIPGWEYFVPVA